MEVQVNIDCADAEALRDFYCDALGYVPKGSIEQYRSCVPGEGVSGPKIIFQQVREWKGPQGRVGV